MLKSLLLLASLALAGTARAETIEMTVNGLVCAFCAQGIEKALRRHPATADVLVSLEDRLVVVGLREGSDIPDAELRTTITNAGYAVKTIERTATTIDEIRARLGKEPE